MSDLSGQEQAQQVRWDILAMLSCELRNPLAPLRNAACLLRLRPDDEQTIEQAAGVAERQVAYLSQIAADPLDSRIGRRVPTDPRTDEILDLLTHEIGTAAANLRNALRGLRPSTGAPAILAAADALDGQVLHLSRFVDDLLDACRLERGKVQMRQERLDLTVLVRTLAEAQHPLLSAAGLALVLDLPARPVWVEGDEHRLGQVVRCLLDNAARFTPPGGRVEVSVQEEDRLACLTVEDTGVGIEPSLLPRLFEPFGQVRRQPGSGRLGLGLALVNRLVGRHGGQVQASSEGPRKGSAFVVRLPLAAEPQPAPAPDEAAARRLRVLVIDDNPDFGDALGTIVQVLGHEVRVARSGPEGLEAARSFLPEVVLCDLGMPEMDGYAVAQVMRNDPATVRARLIAMAAWAMPEDPGRARQAGFETALAKPLDPEALRTLLMGPLDDKQS